MSIRSATPARLHFNLVLGAMLALACLPAAAAVVSDATFANTDWTLTQFNAGNGGLVTGAQVASGGNPGSFRNVTDQLNAAPAGSETIVLSTNIYTPFTYNPSTSGAIATLDYTEDAACTGGCFGAGQSTGPALLQGGNLYILSSSTVITGPGAGWVTHPLSALTANDFGLVSVTPTTLSNPAQHPNFSAGAAPIQFGYFRANGTSVNGPAYTLTAGIDNWQVTVNTATAPPVANSTPVPTMGFWQLAALVGLLATFGLVYARRRR